MNSANEDNQSYRMGGSWEAVERGTRMPTRESENIKVNAQMKRVERVMPRNAKSSGFRSPILRSGSRRGRIPELRARRARRLVEHDGVSAAEMARQIWMSTCAIQKVCGNVIPAGQQRLSPMLR